MRAGQFANLCAVHGCMHGSGRSKASGGSGMLAPSFHQFRLCPRQYDRCARGIHSAMVRRLRSIMLTLRNSFLNKNEMFCQGLRAPNASECDRRYKINGFFWMSSSLGSSANTDVSGLCSAEFCFNTNLALCSTQLTGSPIRHEKSLNNGVGACVYTIPANIMGWAARRQFCTTLTTSGWKYYAGRTWQQGRLQSQIECEATGICSAALNTDAASTLTASQCANQSTCDIPCNTCMSQLSAAVKRVSVSITKNT
jgi:hypothetical protein